MKPASRIVFVLTGSIAGYKACEAISRLVQRGHEVRVVATESALRFVGAATLEGLTGRPVLSDLFARGAALDHIELTRWADLVVICPATANTLNRLAAGLADDLLGASFLAHDRSKPWLVAPAMNPAMWGHPATKAAVATLQGWGVEFIPIGAGRTACGESGEGRLADPVDILRHIEARLARPANRQRILVTSGATAEPIDAMRVLSNISTGQTGAGLASYLANAGHDVVLLRARGSATAEAPCREETFFTFGELASALERLLVEENFDAVIHAAAVSDFAVESVEVNGVAQDLRRAKLDSRGTPVLRLRQNPKLVERLRALSRNPAVLLVAFKLTREAAPPAVATAVSDLFARSGADLVVHNDLAARVDAEIFPADIFHRDGQPAEHCATRGELAAALERRFSREASPEFSSTPSTHAPLP
ncbi:MAG: coaBC [Verrucomicrobia bacterium]|nr:coaBC [Verrucomicrobiota bacterium]